MYDPLYARLEEFEARDGVEVEAVVAPRIRISTSGSKRSSARAQPRTT